MKIAVTYDNGEIFQHFGHTAQFKLYETENSKIVRETVVDTNGSGHGALAGFLMQQGVDTLICGGIVFEYFSYGFGFVGLTLFMMQQVAPGRHQMAHYAFASGIMNLSVMLTGMASGFLSDMLSYKFFFVAVMLATVPAFVITKLVPFTYDDKPNDK